MNEFKDKRITKTLTNKLYSFVDTDNNTYTWLVNGILGFGASGIVYDVSNPKYPSKHYALKEYFPLSLLQYVNRKDDEFEIDIEVLEKWNAGIEDFLKETKIQSVLPNSNTEYGNYFMYAIDLFKANKTAYIVLDTDYCLTLNDYINTAFSLMCNNKNCFSFIKEVFNYHIDICTAVSILHKKGFLHLDISPSNIMINRKTRSARLNDFASAIEYDTKTKIIKSVSLPSYTNAFSPIEQKAMALGNRNVVIGPATDVYSICAVLYRCLFNETYNPVKGMFEKYAENASKIPLCDLLNNNTIQKILQLLESGLCGLEYRIQTAEDLKQNLEHIVFLIESQEEKEKLAKLGLVPSISLAIGYYENFLQDVIYEMLKLKKITINQKEYDVSQYKKEFQVLLPKDISSDWKTLTENYYKQKGYVKFTLEGMRGIGVILDYNALIRRRILRFIDVPQTLRSSFKAVEFVAKNNNTNDIHSINFEKEKEVESFINTILSQAKNDAIVNSILSITKKDI